MTVGVLTTMCGLNKQYDVKIDFEDRAICCGVPMSFIQRKAKLIEIEDSS
jgi:hypothetical protein